MEISYSNNDSNNNNDKQQRTAANLAVVLTLVLLIGGISWKCLFMHISHNKDSYPVKKKSKIPGQNKMKIENALFVVYQKIPSRSVIGAQKNFMTTTKATSGVKVSIGRHGENVW